MNAQNENQYNRDFTTTYCTMGCVGLLSVGLWLIFGASIVNMFKEVQRYRQLEKTVSATKKKSQGIIFNHIYKVLTATLSKEISDLGTYSFIIGSISLFIFSFLTALKLFNFIISLGIAIIIATLPYVSLRLKLRSVQIEGSYDANVLVPSITNEYKQPYFNMINAIENCAVREDIGSYSRKNLFRLSLALKAYYSEEDLDKAIERFVFAYDTEWAVLLGLNGVRNGYSYCWNVGYAEATRDRNINADQKLDTLIMLYETGKWEMEVEDGFYDVTVCVGDTAFNSTPTVNVEGVNYWEGINLGANQYLQATKTVMVNDGRLTIDNGGTADQITKIDYVKIVKAMLRSRLLQR